MMTSSTAARAGAYEFPRFGTTIAASKDSVFRSVI
jgi:hypothetical protein